MEYARRRGSVEKMFDVNFFLINPLTFKKVKTQNYLYHLDLDHNFLYGLQTLLWSSLLLTYINLT